MDENKITEQVLSVADTEAEKRDTAAITTMVASIVQKEREAWAQEIREEHLGTRGINLGSENPGFRKYLIIYYV